ALFSKEDGHAQRSRAQATKVSKEIIQSSSRIENVVQKENIPAANIGKQFRLHVELTGTRGGAPVARCLDEADPQRQIQTSHQVGQEYQAAGEHADDGNRPALKMVADFPRQLGDSFLDPFRRNKNVHDESAW